MRSAIGLFSAGVAAATLAATAHAQAPELNLAYEKFQLDNGLTVIVHEDRKAPVVAVSIWYHVGSKDEPTGKSGFAHLFEHLMFNGSENYDDDWFGPFEEVGATGMNGTTWLDRTNYFQTVPTPALDMALWMESDRMGHLLGAVSQDKLDEQRGVVQNEKRQGDNQPYGRVNYNLYEGLFTPDHPYHHSTIGSMADLDAASLEDVQQWFKDYYGPNNAILVIAGDIDAETARAKVETYFGDIPAGPEVDRWEAWIPVRDADTHEIQFDEVPSVLANRAWAVPGRSTRDKALLDLAAAVLATGKNSRLYKDLIYEKQVATNVNFGITPFEIASVADLSVTLKPDVDASVASESMDRIVAEFIAGGPTAAELERARAGINANTVRGLEQVGGFGGKAVTLAQGELYADDPLFIQTYLDWINAATPADVQAAAARWLASGHHQVDVVSAGDYSNAEEGVDRSTGIPDVPDELPELSFPEIQTAELRNGMQVVLAERHAVPIVQLSMQFDAGYAADFNTKLGVASFAMSMLDEGTKSHDALALAAEAERLGANLTTGSNLDMSSVNLNALKSNLEPSIDLWADVIRNAAFPEEEIERLRTRWIANIEQEKSNPVQLALRLLPPAIYGAGHAYGVPFTGTGTADSVNTITRQDLTTFKNVWLRPDNATIFVAGDATMDEILPILERAFRGWNAPRSALPEKTIVDVALPDRPRVAIIDKPGSPQSLILAGHVAPPSGADNDIAINAMNDVLGGQFSARVNMNLREDKSWAYGAYTFLQDARGQRPFMVYAPVQSDRTGDSLKELVKELNDINAERKVSDEEFRRAVKLNTNALPGQFETAGAVLNSLTTSSRFGRPLDYASSIKQRYDALALDDLRGASAEVVNPNSLIWVIVGDRAEIEQQVRDAGIAEVEIWTPDGPPSGG